MLSLEFILLAASLLLLISVVASKASGRLGVPALVLFLAIGMFAGSDGPGGIQFEDYELTQRLGILALVFILFAGGLDTDWGFVRPALWKGLSLATLGVLITAALVGAFVVLVFDFSWLQGLLVGAIVSSTDAAAVFAIMRSRGVGLKGDLKPLIELESGSNDPMAVFLTTALVSLLQNAETSPWLLIPMLLQQMGLGALCGYLFGRAMTWIVNHLNLEYEGLYPVMTLGLVLLTYSATTLIGGNGFLAIYLAGIVMGNAYLIHKRSLRRFHDGLAWLMQIVMFLTLGLLVFPSRLPAVIGAGLLISAFLILVARPVSVLLTLLPFRMDLRETAMVGWVGLRGAVPIILATFPLLAGIDRVGIIFDLVFFIVLTSVLIQGTTIPLMARWLRVDTPQRQRTRAPLEFEPSHGISGDLIEIELPPSSSAVGKRIVELGLPQGVLLALIGRGDTFLVPGGSTLLEAGDVIHLLAEKSEQGKVHALLTTE
ncbi:MAG: potassium/proton antiporter [Caldilineaceae bacterium]|nr:potassium/proton antiporter [Caldilineaceae bacterium]